jgi:hypothetical protein
MKAIGDVRTHTSGTLPSGKSAKREDTPAGKPGGTQSTGMKANREHPGGDIYPGVGKPKITQLHLMSSKASAMERTVD